MAVQTHSADHLTVPPEAERVSFAAPEITGAWLIRGTVILYLAYLATRLAVFRRLPVFWDEGFHVAVAQTGVDDPAQRFGAIADGKPPLFSWLAMTFIDWGVEPLAAVRLVSVLAGLATLTAVLVLARWLVGRTGVLVAGVLYVLSPYMLVHDVYGLLDGLLAACLTVALVLQIRLARAPSIALALALGAVMGAGILTRQTGYLALLLLPLSLLAFDWRIETQGRRLLGWAVHAGGASLIALAVASVQHLSPYRVVLTPKQNRSVGEALSDPFANVDAIWASFSTTLTGYIGLGVLLLGLVGVAVGLARRDTKVVLVTAWVLAPAALVFLLLRFGFPRYFVAMFPPLVVLAAYGAIAVDGWLAPRLDRTARYAARVIAGALVMSLPVLLLVRILISPGTAPYPSDDRSQLVSGWTAGTGLPEVADMLKEKAGPGVTVVGAVAYTPWNLAALLGHPVRINYGAVPYQDDAQVTLSDGRILQFVRADSAAGSTARFVLTYDEFQTPPDLDLGQYRLIDSFTRPGDATFAGVPTEVTTLRLFERVS